ncbi:MAG: hypothetical protein H0U76_23250 [Ktedonobacteraceae bacterium]|nr:hypothetical protein [Ktedonobacteraceae bacterium]
MEVEMHGKSEVARLRARIERECQAMRAGLTGYAVVSNHEAINHRYDALGDYQQQLEPLVGTEEAARMTVEIYREAMG